VVHTGVKSAGWALVEADLAFAGILFEIGGDIAEFEAHGLRLLGWVLYRMGSMCLHSVKNKKNK